MRDEHVHAELTGENEFRDIYYTCKISNKRLPQSKYLQSDSFTRILMFWFDILLTVLCCLQNRQSKTVARELSSKVTSVITWEKFLVFRTGLRTCLSRFSAFPLLRWSTQDSCEPRSQSWHANYCRNDNYKKILVNANNSLA